MVTTMKKIMLRLRTVVMLVRLGWSQPGMFTIGTFKSMSDIMELLLKVGDTGRPMMTKLAMVVLNEQHDIATIWVGKGANASPYDRITELRDECDALRGEINAMIREKVDAQNYPNDQMDHTLTPRP
jgi:hypothetical protein